MIAYLLNQFILLALLLKKVTRKFINKINEISEQSLKKQKKVISQIYFITKLSEMGAQCTGGIFPGKLPDLQTINRYEKVYISPQEQERRKTHSISLDVFDNDPQLQQKHRMLLMYLSNSQTSDFVDAHFPLQGIKLSRMYDYAKKGHLLFDEKAKSGIQIFKQENQDLTYLSIVLYFLAECKSLLKNQILITKKINPYNLYSFRLYCNGQPHIVLVDDKIPQQNDNPKYATLKGKQIWPILLEKAWCKQTGGYQNALGQSPQHCFEQMLGIPAYSYPIKNLTPKKIMQLCRQYYDKRYWMCLIAYEDLNDQIFMIDSLEVNAINLISSFAHFKFKGQNRSQNIIKVTAQEFEQYFEYLIVGYYINGYEPISYPIQTKKREQKVLKLQVAKRQEVSIRFTQFYLGYLNDQNKSNYEYSPLVFMELYDSNKNILNTCQGCQRVLQEAHSSYLTNDIFHLLDEGVYYLRLQVDWKKEDFINKGNVVVYASKANVSITESQTDSQEMQKTDQVKLQNLIRQLHRSSLHNLPNTMIFHNRDKDYEVKVLEKKVLVIASVTNLTQKDMNLCLDFEKSKNIRVKYEKLVNKKLILSLLPKEQKIFEVVPDNGYESQIAPFDIKTVKPNKSRTDK